MLNFSHIPAGAMETQESYTIYPRIEKLSDTIERIICSGLNGGFSLGKAQKYKRFFPEAMRVLGVSDEESSFENIGSLSISEHFPELVRLYVSMCINDEKSIDALLWNQWQETFKYGDTRISVGERYFYQVYQNVHGDVSLTQYPFIDRVQGDLFGRKWIDVSDTIGVQISCYQETMSFVTALLKGFDLSGNDISILRKTLSELENEETRGVNASDSGTKDHDIRMALNLLSRKKQVHPKYLGISIYSHYNNGYQVAFNNEKQELEFWDIKRENEKIVENKVLSIVVGDIPDILKDLCVLSGRSGDGPRILVAKFLNKRR